MAEPIPWETISQIRFRDANSHVMFNIARARLSMPEGFTEAATP